MIWYHGTTENNWEKIKEEGSSWNIPFGEIVIYDSKKYVDFKETFDDAKKLAEEICRRWNECQNKL